MRREWVDLGARVCCAWIRVGIGGGGGEDEGVETAARWKRKGSSNGTRRRRQREGMGSFVNLISA